MEKEVVVPIALLIVSLMLRLAIAVQGIHGTDVIAHVNGSRSLLLTGSPYCIASYNYPPLYSVLQLASILVFGWNPLGYKFMPILFDSLLSIAIYFAVKMFTGSRRLAIASQILWIFNPLAFVASAWYGLFDSIPALFTLTSILVLTISRNIASASMLAQGIVSKVYPLLYLLPQALNPSNRKLKDIVTYIAVAVTISVAVEVVLSIKCFWKALEYQLSFHLQRIDRGLSLAPYTPYSSIASLSIPTAILTIIAYLMRIRGRYNAENYFAWASTCTALTIALNPFIYPHYLIWLLPLALIYIICRFEEKGIAVALLYILIFSAIGIAYWKFYRVSSIVTILSISLYTALASLILTTTLSNISRKQKL